MIKIIKKLKNEVDKSGILEFPLLLDDMTDSICGKTNLLYTFSIFILSILYYTFTISLTISMFIVSIWYDIEMIYDYFNKTFNKNYYKNNIIKALKDERNNT